MQAVSPEELAKIEELAERMIRDGEHNQLDEWMKDPSQMPKVRQILEAENLPYHAGCFALQALCGFVQKLFGFWGGEDQYNFTVWYDSLLQKQYGLLWGDGGTRAAYTLYIKLYGHVMACGWNAGPQFRELLQGNFEKFGASANYVFCAALGEFAQEMAARQNVEFRMEMMPVCLNYAFLSLRQAGDERTANTALDAILNILSFEVRFKDLGKDNFPNQTYDFNVQSIAICCAQENVESLFAIASKCVSDKCFSILTLLSSANTAILPKQVYGHFLVQVMEHLLQIPVDMPSKILKSFTRLALRLKVALHSNAFEYDLPRFLEYMMSVSERQIPNVREETDAVHNLLLFWGQFGDSTIFEIVRMRIAVAKCFIESSLKEFESDEAGRDYTADVFSLSDTKAISPLCLALKPIVANLLPEFTKHILQPIYQGLLETTASNRTGQMALFCNCILGMTHRLRLDVIGQDTQDMIATLQMLFKFLMFDVYQPHYAVDYVVCSLLLFVRQFRHYEFMAQCGSVSQMFYKDFGDIHGIEDMLSRLFRLTWDILTNVGNREVLFDATLALASLLDARTPFHPFVMKLPLLPDLLRGRVEKPFPFLSNPTFTKCRVALHQALCPILVHKDAGSLRTEFLRMYNDVFAREKDDIIGFLCDFAGFFRGAVQPAQWSVFFSYVFPDGLRRIISVAPKITDIQDAVHIVRFWSMMLNNDPRRIEFKHHSANGVILFNLTTELLYQFESLLKSQPKENELLVVKFLGLCFLIINSALNACYVPFAAYETFHDETLQKMVGLFAKLAVLLPVDRLAKYQKVDRAVSHTNTTIVTKHINVISQLGLEHLNLSMNIILAGLRSLDEEVRRSSVEALETMVLRHFDTMTKMDRQKFVHLTFRIWHLCLTKPSQYTWRHCLVSVIMKDKSVFIQACERMLEGSVPEKTETLRGEYQKLLESLPDLFNQKEGDIMKAVEDFIHCARHCIRFPDMIFNV